MLASLLFAWLAGATILVPQETGQVRAELDEARARVQHLEEQPERATELADALSALGELLLERRQHAEALPPLERALAIREEALGFGHESTAASYNSLGLLLQMRGELAAAEDCLRAALESCEAVHGARSEPTITVRTNLASLLLDRDDAAGAIALLAENLELCRELLGDESHETASATRTLASVRLQLGQLDEARRLYEDALAVYAALYGEEHPALGQTLNGLGVTLRRAGRAREAGEHFERCLAILARAEGPDSANATYVRFNLAMTRIDRGELVQARRDLERALANAERLLGPTHPLVAQVLASLAAALLDLGDVPRAYEHARRGLELRIARFGPNHTETADAHTQVAAALRRLEQPSDELVHLRRALDIRAAAQGVDNVLTLRARAHLGEALALAGEADAAERELELVLESLERQGLSDRGEGTRAIAGLAVVARLRGDLDRARALFEEAITRRLEVQAPSEASVVYERLRLAEVLADAGDLDGAWGEARDALRDARGRLGEALAAVSEAGAFKLLARTYEDVCLFLSLSDALDTAESRRGALAELLQWRGAAGRLSSVSRARLRAGDAGHDRLGRFRAVQAALATATLSGGVDEAELARLHAERERLELELRRAADAALPAAPSYDTLRAALAEGEAFVQLFVHPRYRTGDELSPGDWEAGQRVSAWIVRAELEAPVHVDLGPADPLNHSVAEHLYAIAPDLRAALATRGLGVTARPEVVASSDPLRALLWTPLAPALAGVERLFIAPDRFLAALPWETLVLEDGAFLVERMACVYVQDVAQLARTRRARAYSSLLCVGGVEFGEPAEGERAWSPLPGTRAEARAVAELHARARPDGARLVLEGRAAATARNPGLLCGLVCADADSAYSDGADDGYLTAEEVGWLDLGGTELVVLSACETALGRDSAGEGLVGLRRAFHLAGARTVISSLWPVQDDAAGELMRGFYRALLEQGAAPHAALRAAQLELLARNRRALGAARPDTWGAFVLSGEWR